MMDPRKTAMFNRAIEVFKEAGKYIHVACPDTGLIWVSSDRELPNAYRYQSTTKTWAYGPVNAKNLRNEPDILEPEELVAEIDDREARYDA